MQAQSNSCFVLPTEESIILSPVEHLQHSEQMLAKKETKKKSINWCIISAVLACNLQLVTFTHRFGHRSSVLCTLSVFFLDVCLTLQSKRVQMHHSTGIVHYATILYCNTIWLRFAQTVTYLSNLQNMCHIYMVKYKEHLMEYDPLCFFFYKKGMICILAFLSINCKALNISGKRKILNNCIPVRHAHASTKDRVSILSEGAK